MSKQVFTDAVVIVNGIDLTNHCSEITIEDTADEVDLTSFGGNGYREIGQGLKDATITGTFFQDYATGSVDSVLQPLYASGGTFSLSVKPTSATASATNPWHRMTARLYSYGGLGGAIGDALNVEATFRNAANGISRGTSGTV
jgi:hypothetical protein